MVHKQSQEGRRGSEKGETEIRIEPKLLDAPTLDAETERIRIVLMGSLGDLSMYERESLKGIPALLSHIAAQEQTIEAHRPVVEAAVEWRGTYGWTPKMEVGARAQALVAAVDAYRERG